MTGPGPDWEHLESLFARASELPAAEREPWLRELSVSDPALARELASLLEFDPNANRQLHGIVDRLVADAAQIPRWSGQVFGAYRVVRTIAAGGMGTVFEAVREQDYHKRVALKVAASAIGTPAWVERFQQERQILAGLDHPNIARFLDGGASAEGLPYFAMELVEGEPITDFVRRRKSGIRERLHLFRKVCAAVSFAHQSLVVHRDLKPGNILVTADGEPKLLDFGLARLQSALEPDLGLTQTSVPLLTPSYCSPEQVLGGKITTRVDVYLLGLVLFELLTGEQAHHLTSGSPAELQRVVSEAEPPVPSARAEASGERSLSRALRGDLDTIVLKAIQKDPEQRYRSVDDLNEDLARFLDGRPILARPAGWRYGTVKFLRRNWIPTLACAAVFLALLIGALGFAWQARIAGRRFELARRLANSLLFDIHDKVQQMPGGIQLREQISSTAVEYLDALSREAGRNYALRRELAAGYLRLTSARWSESEAAPVRSGGDSAVSTLNRALALLEGMPASELARAASIEARLRNKRGNALREKGNTDAAQVDFERSALLSSCPTGREELCENRIFALYNLANVMIMRRDWAASQGLIASMRSTMETYRQTGGESFYQGSVLGAGFLEMKIAQSQLGSPEAAEIMLRLVPVAQKMGAQQNLDPRTLHRLALHYQSLGWLLRSANKGTPAERIAFEQRALGFSQRALELDGADVVAQLAVGSIEHDIAIDYENLNPTEAARFYHQALEIALKRPELIVNNLEARILFWERGRDAIRFFLRDRRPADATSVANQVSAIISPAIFLGLEQPRSPEAQQVQALWWSASESVHEKSSSAETLWGQAVSAARQAMLHSPQDAVIQASAALAYEGWADWLRAAGRQPEDDPCRRESQELWARLGVAFPGNGYIRKHVHGSTPASHGNP